MTVSRRSRHGIPAHKFLNTKRIYALSLSVSLLGGVFEVALHEWGHVVLVIVSLGAAHLGEFTHHSLQLLHLLGANLLHDLGHALLEGLGLGLASANQEVFAHGELD